MSDPESMSLSRVLLRHWAWFALPFVLLGALAWWTWPRAEAAAPVGTFDYRQY